MQLEMFSLTPYPLKGGPEYLYLKKTKVGLRLYLSPRTTDQREHCQGRNHSSRFQRQVRIIKNQSWA